MAKKTSGPLKREHLERLNHLLQSCAETRQYLQDCTDCFLDVDKEMKVNDEQERIASAIKAKFFRSEK